LCICEGHVDAQRRSSLLKKSKALVLKTFSQLDHHTRDFAVVYSEIRLCGKHRR
jgi:hypothetical protein